MWGLRIGWGKTLKKWNKNYSKKKLSLKGWVHKGGFKKLGQEIESQNCGRKSEFKKVGFKKGGSKSVVK